MTAPAVVPMTPAARFRARATALAEKTADAFSYDRYRSWAAVALMLLRRGYSEAEAEAILRSKWTRWAADKAQDNGHAYGHATADDVATWLDENERETRRIAELVAGTL